MRELSSDEIESVNGGYIANVGMAMAGAMGGMATYSLQGGIGGSMSGAGFVGAAVGGAIYGAGAFNPAAGLAGAAIGAGVKGALEEDS